jgi:hypothetical protein
MVGDSVSTGSLDLVFNGFSDEGLDFEVKNQNTSDYIKVSLKYWSSFIDYFSSAGHQNSGDYIFRPMHGQFKANPYSSYLNGSISGS